MGFKKIYFQMVLKTLALKQPIKCNSKMAYEVMYLDLPLHSFVLNTKTKPRENVKFMKAEMFIDTGQQQTAKHAVTFLVSRSRRLTVLQFFFCPY